MSLATNDRNIYNLVHGKKSPDGSKTYWNRVGIAIYDQDKDRISIHLDQIPIGADWDGWLSAFPKEDDTSNSTSSNSRSASNTRYDDGDFDDIPFN